MATEETKQCSRCPALMIKEWEDIVLLSMPPQYRYNWKCGCGYTERGATVRGREPETFHEKWERVNDKSILARLVRFNQKLCDAFAKDE